MQFPAPSLWFDNFNPEQLETLLPALHGRQIICVDCNWWWKELVHVSCTSSIKLVSHCCCNQSTDWSCGWAGKAFTQYMNCFFLVILVYTCKVKFLSQAWIRAVRASKAGQLLNNIGKFVIKSAWQNYSACFLWTLVCMSPETAVNCTLEKYLWSAIFQKHLVLVAVDEAHLIHEW